MEASGLTFRKQKDSTEDDYHMDAHKMPAIDLGSTDKSKDKHMFLKELSKTESNTPHHAKLTMKPSQLTSTDNLEGSEPAVYLQGSSIETKPLEQNGSLHSKGFESIGKSN